MKQLNPNFGPVSYINTDACDAQDVEPVSRFGVAFYLAGTLGASVSAEETMLQIVPETGTSTLKASAIEGDFSGRKPGEYVTFVRVGDELMRMDRVEVVEEDRSETDPERRFLRWRGVDLELLDVKAKEKSDGKVVLHVQRGFGGSKADVHSSTAKVFAPLYNAEGYPGGKAGVIYTIDPATPYGVGRLVNHTLEKRAEGYAGSWFDCFSATQYNAVDMGGKRVQHGWDFNQETYFTRDTFLAAQKKRLSNYWQVVHTNLSLFPLTLANNMDAGYWPDEGNDRSMLIPAEGFRPLDGYCMECFIGKEMLNDPYSYGCNASALNFTWLGPNTWKHSVQRLMDAAQNGLAALPMLAQAGCKSVKLEMMSNESRDQIETYAYASYLLAVNSTTGPTRLGIPAFYRANGKRFVFVHRRYAWPLGEPAQTFSSDNIDKYRPEGHASYVRKFTNGLILVNPTTTIDKDVKFDRAYFDPVTRTSTSSVDVPANSGMILLVPPPT